MDQFQDSKSLNGINEPQTGNQWTPEKVSTVSNWALITLLIGVILGLLAVTAKFYYIAAMIGAVILLALVSWQFEAALAIYALAAFIPWGRTPDLAVGGSGEGKGVFVCEAMLGFLLVVWFCRYLMRMLPDKRIPSGFYVPLGLYLAYCTINIIHSYIFWDAHVNRLYQHPSVNVIELGMRILSAGALIIIATSLTNTKWLKITTGAIMFAGFYNIFNAILNQAIPVMTPWWPLVAMLPMCYCWLVVLNEKKWTTKRIVCAIIVALCVNIIVIKSIAWVSGWLGLMAALAAVTFIKNRRVFVIGLLGFCVILALGWGFIQKEVISTSATEGDYDRFSLMAGALKYATHFPLGVGLGNYRTFNGFYYGNKWGTTNYTSAHGTYAQALSETGFPGFILLLAFLICGFRWLYVNYKELDDGYSKTFLLAAMGQTVGIAAAACLGDYLIPAYHNGGLANFSATVYSWLTWGLAIAHVRLSREQ